MQWNDVSTAVTDFVAEQHLPPGFVDLSARYYLPLANHLLEAKQQRTAPLLLGINGAQGTGKSTLAALFGCILTAGANWRCAILSIDDLYLTRAEREELAQSQHPLLRVRGVPGTHDVDLGLPVLKQLQSYANGSIALPRFDKSRDDRKPEHEWSLQILPVDLIILEGWCVGAKPQAEAELEQPINRLEAEEDKTAEWRTYVNQQLAQAYQPLFAKLDYLVMLKAPSMEAIEEWRWLQEQKLIAATEGKGEGLMTQAQVKRFIQHYERLTRHILQEMPSRADAVFHLSHDHTIAAASGPLATGIA